MKFSLKILISLILICLVPLVIVVGIYNNSVNKMIDDKVSVFFKQIVKQNASNIDQEIDHIEKILNSIVGNELLQDELDNYGEKKNIDKLGSWLKVDSIVNSAFALNMNIRSVIFSMYDVEKVKIFGEDALEDGIFYEKYFQYHFDKTLFKDDNLAYPVWKYKLVDDPSRIYVMKELVAYNSGNPLGIVIFAVDTDFFNDVIRESYTGNDEKVFLLDEENKYVYEEDTALLGQPSKENFIGELVNDNGLLYEDNTIIVYAKLHNRYTLISKVAINNLIKDIRAASGTIMVVGIICILLAIFISILFSKYVSRKFQVLISYMKKVQKGDFDINYRKSKSTDEFSVIFDYFSKMVSRLKNLIKTNYVQEIEKKEAKLNALQYQINPHFLYNTLEVIRSMSMIHHCEEIGNVSHKLGELFRYNLNKSSDDYILLQDELEHIRNYVYLMNIHYNNNIQLYIDIDDDRLNNKILRFIFQPIIENSIMYGFKDRNGQGCIEISTMIQDNELIISIADDGIGITQERIKEVEDYMNDGSYSIQSVGLRNVNQRLKLAFGDHYGVQIESDSNTTIVKLNMPIIGG